MKKFLIKTLSLVLICFSIFLITPQHNLEVEASFEDEPCKAYVLIDRNTCSVLTSKNEHEKLPIASVTKLMTVLLTFEEIKNGNISLNDKVIVSENANGMGGSQIFLDANTEYVLSDLIKSVIVASANDSSVAIAEYIAGSENNFVNMMNEKAASLNMNDTHYNNCTGLPSSGAFSSAFDQAILLNEVLKFEEYHNYSSIWNEDFVHPSGRTTQMTNTNKLSRFYSGCIGGKTGSTSEAKFCLAVGAKRDNMETIAVVLGADTTKIRFKLASDLLDYGFNNFESKTVFSSADLEKKEIYIKGTDKTTKLSPEKDYHIVCKKNEVPNFSLNFNLPKMLSKVNEGEIVGNVEIVIDGIVKDTINILATETIEEPSVWDYFLDVIEN